MKHLTWIIHGFEGLSDDFGCSEPWTAAEFIRSRQAKGEVLSKDIIEQIAHNFGCWVEWKESIS